MNKFHVFQYQRCSVFAASFHANVVCIAALLNENETKKYIQLLQLFKYLNSFTILLLFLRKQFNNYVYDYYL